MRLFLSGGGSIPFELDRRFIETIDKAKPMLYIPIAMNPLKHPFPECLEWIRRYFSGFGFTNIEMVTDLKNISREKLDSFGSVYVGGGNTPFLLKSLRETGFMKSLKYLIKKDIPIAGGSAGAIIFAKTIIPALSSDENSVGLKDFSALDELDGYELWCHYDSSHDVAIEEFMDKYGLEKVLALPESCGVYAKENERIIEGSFSAFIFDKDGKREVKNAEKF